MSKNETLEALNATIYSLIELSVSLEDIILDADISKDALRVHLGIYATTMSQIEILSVERLRVYNEPAPKKTLLNRIFNKN